MSPDRESFGTMNPGVNIFTCDYKSYDCQCCDCRCWEFKGCIKKKKELAMDLCVKFANILTLTL